jgi:hypothetical protein
MLLLKKFAVSNLNQRFTADKASSGPAAPELFQYLNVHHLSVRDKIVTTSGFTFDLTPVP